MSTSPKQPLQPSAVHDWILTKQSDKDLQTSLSEILSTLADLSRHAHRTPLLCICRKLVGLDPRRMALVEEFLQQIIQIHDPNVVDTFLSWKEHPVLDSILLLGSKLDEDQQYELLELAEELNAQNRGLRQRSR